MIEFKIPNEESEGTQVAGSVPVRVLHRESEHLGSGYWLQSNMPCALKARHWPSLKQVSLPLGKIPASLR